MPSAEGELHSPDGTVAWAAPEQCDGAGRCTGRYTDKVDMWSVGCVVYYLLTSLSPFNNRSVDDDPAVIAQYKFPFWPRLYHRAFFDANERQPGHFVMVRGVSSEANRFLRLLMSVSPAARLSAKEALENRWINPDGTELMDVALRAGNQELVDMLTKSSKEQRSDLHKLRLVAAGGHLEFVQRILRGRTEPVMDEDGGGGGKQEVVLVGAAAGGHSEVVAVLLAQVKYHTRREGINVMRAACRRALEGRHTGVVAQLWPLVLGYDFADIADNGVKLMAAVAAFGTEKMLRDIIPSAQPHIEAMIQAAASHGNIESLATLFFSGHGLGHSLQDSALLEAASSGQLLVVRYLLDRRNVFRTIPLPPGTPISAHDVFSNALSQASSNGHLSILQELFMRGIAPTQDAIAAAASHNHSACFEFLVRTLRDNYNFPLDAVFMYITPAGMAHCTLCLLKRYPHPALLVPHVGDVARLGRVDAVEWLLGLVDDTGAGVRDALVAAAGAGQGEVLEAVLGMGRATQSDVWHALGSAMEADQLGTRERLMIALDNGPYLRH